MNTEPTNNSDTAPVPVNRGPPTFIDDKGRKRELFKVDFSDGFVFGPVILPLKVRAKAVERAMKRAMELRLVSLASAGFDLRKEEKRFLVEINIKRSLWLEEEKFRKATEARAKLAILDAAQAQLGGRETGPEFVEMKDAPPENT